MVVFGLVPGDVSRQLLWTSLAFAGVLLLLALVVALLERWRKRSPQERLSAGDQLAHFRELYEQGELSREEYARLHALLSERIREEMEVEIPPAPAAPTEAAKALPQADGDGNGVPRDANPGV